MSLLFVIPGPLRELAGNRGQIRLDGRPRSAGDALSLLWSECPALRDRVLNELGEVRPHVNVFIDGENIRDLGGLAARVGRQSEIVIVPALSGG